MLVARLPVATRTIITTTITITVRPTIKIILWSIGNAMWYASELIARNSA
ncbi:MAG: hypothetical protein JRN52_07575 [Nitrososphaerota archaeon]|nr:hypothetical protein [Nitrososphaerota archaeon]